MTAIVVRQTFADLPDDVVAVMCGFLDALDELSLLAAVRGTRRCVVDDRVHAARDRVISECRACPEIANMMQQIATCTAATIAASGDPETPLSVPQAAAQRWGPLLRRARANSRIAQLHRTLDRLICEHPFHLATASRRFGTARAIRDDCLTESGRLEIAELRRMYVDIAWDVTPRLAVCAHATLMLAEHYTNIRDGYSAPARWTLPYAPAAEYDPIRSACAPDAADGALRHRVRIAAIWAAGKRQRELLAPVRAAHSPDTLCGIAFDADRTVSCVQYGAAAVGRPGWTRGFGAAFTGITPGYTICAFGFACGIGLLPRSEDIVSMFAPDTPSDDEQFCAQWLRPINAPVVLPNRTWLTRAVWLHAMRIACGVFPGSWYTPTSQEYAQLIATTSPCLPNGMQDRWSGCDAQTPQLELSAVDPQLYLDRCVATLRKKRPVDCLDKFFAYLLSQRGLRIGAQEAQVLWAPGYGLNELLHAWNDRVEDYEASVAANAHLQKSLIETVARAGGKRSGVSMRPCLVTAGLRLIADAQSALSDCDITNACMALERRAADAGIAVARIHEAMAARFDGAVAALYQEPASRARKLALVRDLFERRAPYTALFLAMNTASARASRGPGRGKGATALRSRLDAEMHALYAMSYCDAYQAHIASHNAKRPRARTQARAADARGSEDGDSEE